MDPKIPQSAETADRSPRLLVRVYEFRRGGRRRYVQSVLVPGDMSDAVKRSLKALEQERKRLRLQRSPGVPARLAG